MASNAPAPAPAPQEANRPPVENLQAMMNLVVRPLLPPPARARVCASPNRPD